MANYKMVKHPGGVLAPIDDATADRLTRLKTGEVYPVDITIPRNYGFHKKVFNFINFCYAHWSAENTDYRHLDEEAQKEQLREDLTIKAGYFYQVYDVRKQQLATKAKSISYASMDQDAFERYYNSLINAALELIFGGTKNQNTINQLYSYF